MDADVCTTLRIYLLLDTSSCGHRPSCISNYRYFQRVFSMLQLGGSNQESSSRKSFHDRLKYGGTLKNNDKRLRKNFTYNIPYVTSSDNSLYD